MPASRRNVNDEMIKLARRMNQLMDEWMHASFASAPQDGWQPLVDVIECEHRVCILADLAGVVSEAVRVEVRGSTVVISGTRLLPGADRQKLVHQLELPRGPFRRVVGLPFEAESLPVEIRCADGLLEILIDKPNP